MGIIDELLNKIRPKSTLIESSDDYYEYCPHCYANLTIQKGYDPSLKYWECKGCGQMLINPEAESDIVWICDECGAVMNEQEGFSEEYSEWKCSECGFVNKIDPSEIQTNRALKLYGMTELYAKDPRDACIIVAINNRIFDQYEVDELLIKQGLKKITADE